MSKLGVRKDCKQNAERGLKHTGGVDFISFEGNRETGLRIGHIGSSASRLENQRERLKMLTEAKKTCNNPACTSGDVDCPICSACRRVYFCCRECQLANWDAHKKQCKQWRKELEAADVEKAESTQAVTVVTLKASATCATGGGDIDEAVAEAGDNDDKGDEEDEEGYLLVDSVTERISKIAIEK